MPSPQTLGGSQMNRLVPGNLYKFQYINRTNEHLNGKLVMYLGEDHIKRADGIVVKNFRIHMVGEDRPRIYAHGMRHHLKDID